MTTAYKGIILKMMDDELLHVLNEWCLPRNLILLWNWAFYIICCRLTWLTCPFSLQPTSTFMGIQKKLKLIQLAVGWLFLKRLASNTSWGGCVRSPFVRFVFQTMFHEDENHPIPHINVFSHNATRKMYVGNAYYSSSSITIICFKRHLS